MGSSKLCTGRSTIALLRPMSKNSGVSQLGAEAGSAATPNSVEGRRHPGSML
ncbi:MULTISPECIES: hypothetical protein [unclassified Microcoleus]|uniref:hypothetical protein n=1 Tax=unclassified Microcoleus TaxID=2642155 RepID=UPI002FCFC593